MFSRNKQKPTSKSHTSPSKQKHNQKDIAQEPQQPPTSFLFSTSELTLNEDSDNGGISPRLNEDGRWAPPVRHNGFHRPVQVQGHVYRWRDGQVSEYQNCVWHESEWWMTEPAQPATPLWPYKSSSIFWCTPWTQFFTAKGDASSRDIEDSQDYDNRWFPLNFEHDGPLSRLAQVGDEYLAGTGEAWIGHLGLDTYNNSNAPLSTGLAGDLSHLVGLIAFSCQPHQLRTILIEDRAWRRRQWRHHSRTHGRDERRGILAAVYYDHENTAGSTLESLGRLEWEEGALIR